MCSSFVLLPISANMPEKSRESYHGPAGGHHFEKFLSCHDTILSIC